ncbi:MAG TPA: hypothetical protein VF167_09505 [Longimicrobiaceae bacterium]
MERRAQIRVALNALRVLLDLPPHLRITGVYQTRDDASAERFTIAVSGPWCPVATFGQPLPVLTPVYVDGTTHAPRLVSIDGLDT